MRDGTSSTGPIRARPRSRPTCRSRAPRWRATIREAHARGIKVTGHLCSVTYGEAADLGIDNLEHGFIAATDFVADKQPDVCPGQGQGGQSVAALDDNGAPFKALVKKLIDKRVALTSTLTVFEVSTPGRPLPPGLDVLTPQLKQQFEQTYARVSQNKESPNLQAVPQGAWRSSARSRAPAACSIAGTDPTGPGGVIPGYSNQRQIELLVDAGFTPLEAIRIATRTARVTSDATRASARSRPASRRIWSCSRAIPSTPIADVRKVEIVFRQGVGYDPAKLIDSVSRPGGVVLATRSPGRAKARPYHNVWASSCCRARLQPGLGQMLMSKVKVKVFDRSGNLVGPIDVDRVEKTDAEWQQQLTPEQYQIARGKGTERPFCGTLLDNKRTGVYTCICCRLPLFSSDGKFNSGTGWPSFFKPVAEENVITEEDRAYGMRRVEILCARCDAHLGHVFDDGPRPTGLRFCVNSESLSFTDSDKVSGLGEA